MNSVNIIGRLTSNVELKMTPTGISVCSFSVAVKRPKVKDTTDFINCVAWRQSAEYLCKYSKKGSVICISGILTQRQYDKNGEKRYITEVIVDTLSVLSDGSGGQSLSSPTENTNNANSTTYANVEQAKFEEISLDSDLPF